MGKGNPNLGVSVKLDFLRSECARAVEMPTYENTFRQLYLKPVDAARSKVVKDGSLDAGFTALPSRPKSTGMLRWPRPCDDF
jgi:hypothetical protein